jgi:predicted neuraminidase
MRFLKSMFYFFIAAVFFVFNSFAMVPKSPVVASFDVPKPKVRQVHASNIIEVSPGKFLCVFFGGSGDGKPDVKIWSSFFDVKNGKWSEPVVIANSQEIDGITEAAEMTACWDPVLFKIPNGNMLLFYKLGKKPTDWTGYVKTSIDGGQTWASIKRLPPGILGPAKNKPICIPGTGQSYSLVCGSSSESWNRAWGCWFDILNVNGDQEQWLGVGPVYVEPTKLKEPEGIIQPTFFWDKDKNLRMLCRTKNIGKLCTAVSKDNGKTWSKVEKTVLNSNNSSVETINLQDGRVLLAYSDINEKDVPEKNRYKLDLAISSDGGDTWKNVFELDNSLKDETLKDDKGNPLKPEEKRKKQISYPSVIQASDGRVHIVYTYNREKLKHVILDPNLLK